eukprot:m.98441 g.98441  ORF g.98441 m.98441 type:complete len:129 (-) comp27065_c0_seq2:31-417(-)
MASRVVKCRRCELDETMVRCDDCGETFCDRCALTTHGKGTKFEAHTLFNLAEELQETAKIDVTQDQSLLLVVVAFQFLLPIIIVVIFGILFGRIDIFTGVQGLAGVSAAIVVARLCGVPLQVFTGAGV